jgi:hypothetical protein
MEESMEGILFFIIWIGGALIHTIVELRLQKSGPLESRGINSTGRHHRGENDGW